MQARLQEAEAHRRAKQGNGRMPYTLPLRMAILVGVGVIAVLWLLTSCTTIADTMVVDSETAVMVAGAQASQEETETEIEIETELEAGSATGRTMAERIHFQDRREQYLAVGTGSAVHPADRKFFNATEGGTKTLLQPIPRH
ncbi:MAG TPA: hypothetical protein VF177_22435 [Anaerolineae bacterium]